jgi:hypothetical protein
MILCGVFYLKSHEVTVTVTVTGGVFDGEGERAGINVPGQAIALPKNPFSHMSYEIGSWSGCYMTHFVDVPNH